MENIADEELYDLYCSSRMGGTCGTYGNVRKTYRVLVRKPEGDQLEDLGVGGRKLLASILKRRRSRGLAWLSPSMDRDRWQAVVNTVMNLQVPLNAGNIMTSSGTVRFSR